MARFQPGKGKYSKFDKRIREIYDQHDGKISLRAIARKIQDENEEYIGHTNSFRAYITRLLRSNPEHQAITPDEVKNKVASSSSTKDYNKPKFVLSAWDKKSETMMDIDKYCENYGLPRKDITSYKLVSHTGTPYYNVVFKENLVEEVMNFDVEEIVKRHIIRVSVIRDTLKNPSKDFDALTYTDVHIGMDTNKYDNSMYPVVWDREKIIETAMDMVQVTLYERESNVLVIDELGDFLDGLNAQTTRGGHHLPQNMTNEEAFDCALSFKMLVIDNLCQYYDRVICNNICNDNHAGSFGYFVNSAFKQIVEQKYDNVEVNNHRKFINHYYMGDTCFIITHGKDDSTLKFGFKPNLDSNGLEKIDQYCKQNDIYKKSSQIVFKKGDSHQALFDMCTSDDFYYFNYPALSPSSQWVQNNFKKGRRGFVNESYLDSKPYIKPNFIR
jgi:hypothetical protein